MPYKLVKGEFGLFYNIDRHVGSRPDGDSVWFKPDDPTFLMGLGDPPRNTRFNSEVYAQIRIEGIDALELHYKGSNHQNKESCTSARDKMLELVGFTDIEYAPNLDIPSYVRSSTPVTIRGYILTRNIDPFERPVAFIFKGDSLLNDGFEIWLNTQQISQSVNAKLMEAGEVYPAYYTGLPADLRNYLTNHAVTARGQNLGLWAIDTSMTNNQVTMVSDLTYLAIWPKIYRRLFKFFKEGNTNLGNFENWLRDNPSTRDDSLWIISEAHLGNIHDIIDVTSNSIRMVFQPEDIVLIPR